MPLNESDIDRVKIASFISQQTVSSRQNSLLTNPIADGRDSIRATRSAIEQIEARRNYNGRLENHQEHELKKLEKILEIQESASADLKKERLSLREKSTSLNSLLIAINKELLANDIKLAELARYRP